MDTQNQKITFVMACMKFFGKKPSQNLKEFNEELKALTPTDRTDLAAMFREVGYDVTDFPAPVVAAA